MCCVALPRCLFDLASFFLPSLISHVHVIIYFADFRSEVESETIGSHEGTSLVGLPQHLPEGKVQSVCARVVLHDQTASILQHIHGTYPMYAHIQIYYYSTRSNDDTQNSLNVFKCVNNDRNVGLQSAAVA